MSDKSQKTSKKNYVPRITQLDAIEFDKEIYNVLSTELQKVNKHLPPGALNDLKPEINLFLNLLIFYYSVINKNATFGQELLSLKYKNVLSKKHIIIMIFVNFIMPYFKSRYEVNSRLIHNNIVRKTIEKIEVFVKIQQFVNLLIFLREGKYPTVVDRVLHLTYSGSNNLNQNIGYNYMTRELLWHGFMELLKYILPLINYKAMKRKVRETLHIKSHHIKKEKKILLKTETKCVICNDLPVSPCQISLFCPHLACYYCIKSNVLADEKFMCPVCAEINTTNEHLKFLRG